MALLFRRHSDIAHECTEPSLVKINCHGPLPQSFEAIYIWYHGKYEVNWVLCG